MRRPREITAAEENFRMEQSGPFHVIRRDPVEPEPIGTIILVPMQVIGYDPDCDGSLMARYLQLSLDEIDDRVDDELLGLERARVSQYSGVSTNHGIYPTTGLVVTPAELTALIKESDAQVINERT